MSPMKFRILLAGATALAAVAAVRATASARDERPLAPSIIDASVTAPAGTIFLAIPGIDGEARFPGRNKEIEVLAFTLSAGQAGNAAGGMVRGGGGKASLEDIRIVKGVDRASPKLLEAALIGKPIAQAKIDFLRAGQPKTPYLSYALKNVVVSSVQLTASASGEPTEEVTLRVGGFDLEYTSVDAKGGANASVTTSWTAGIR